MRNLIFLYFFGASLLSINCQSSTSDFSSLKIVDNIELKSILFNIDDSFLHKDKRERFFIKGFKITSTEEIDFDEGHEKMQHYLFAVSSMDENPEIDGELYKTKSFNYPKLIEIIDNNEENCFEIEITHKILENGETVSLQSKIIVPYFKD